MAGRSHTPLFEAMTKRAGEGGSTSGSGRAVTGSGGAGRISLPVSAMYGIVTGVLILAFVIWTIAFQVGRQSGKQEAIDQFNRGLPRGPDPLLGDGRGGLISDVETLAVDRGTNGRSAGGGPAERTDGSPTATAGGTFTVRGWIDDDRRMVGHNYLKLASRVGVDEAQRLIAFLAARGVEVMGVPADSPRAVDAGGSAGNDSGPVDLYSLGLAVPSERYRAMQSARERHQQLLSRLGAEWMARHRGTVNFAQTGWELYRGR